MSPGQVEAVNKLFTAFNDTQALAAVVRGWKDLAVSDEELKANRVPTLALVGENDPLRKGVDEMRGRMANLKVVVIPRADHVSAVLRPEFVGALRAFLADHKGQATAPPSSSPRRSGE